MLENSVNFGKFRIFLLSPAKAGGKRSDLLLNPNAGFDLAVRIRNGGAQLGEVFSFMSGLYFRGKLAYANHFSRAVETPGVLVITTDRGLVPATTWIRKQDLLSFSGVEIDPSDHRYVQSLQASARNLAETLSSDSEIVLLGSIGTKKYTELLVDIFGSRLKFPAEFVGRGDMSRGGLLLRSVAANRELEYVPVMGAIRHGKRPPKLDRLLPRS
jgi:hypothetical protein